MADGRTGTAGTCRAHRRPPDSPRRPGPGRSRGRPRVPQEWPRRAGIRAVAGSAAGFCGAAGAAATTGTRAVVGSTGWLSTAGAGRQRESLMSALARRAAGAVAGRDARRRVARCARRGRDGPGRAGRGGAERGGAPWSGPSRAGTGRSGRTTGSGWSRRCPERPGLPDRARHVTRGLPRGAGPSPRSAETEVIREAARSGRLKRSGCPAAGPADAARYRGPGPGAGRPATTGRGRGATTGTRVVSAESPSAPPSAPPCRGRQPGGAGTVSRARAGDGRDAVRGRVHRWVRGGPLAVSDHVDVSGATTVRACRPVGDTGIHAHALPFAYRKPCRCGSRDHALPVRPEIASIPTCDHLRDNALCFRNCGQSLGRPT